jgi:hypothetical protein
MPWEQRSSNATYFGMGLIRRIKEWEVHAVFNGERPSWWRRLLIRLVVGTKFPKKMKAEFPPL